MNDHDWKRRFATPAALALVLALAAVSSTFADDDENLNAREKEAAAAMAQLKGDWTATFSGVTGCGVSTALVDFTLDATGNGIQSFNLGHTAACGDSITTGLAAQVTSLNPDGSGTIGFACGPNCGFNFTMQVSRNKQYFNMSAEPVGGNFLAGVAVRK